MSLKQQLNSGSDHYQLVKEPLKKFKNIKRQLFCGFMSPASSQSKQQQEQHSNVKSNPTIGSRTNTITKENSNGRREDVERERSFRKHVKKTNLLDNNENHKRELNLNEKEKENSVSLINRKKIVNQDQEDDETKNVDIFKTMKIDKKNNDLIDNSLSNRKKLSKEIKNYFTEQVKQLDSTSKLNSTGSEQSLVANRASVLDKQQQYSTTNKISPQRNQNKSTNSNPTINNNNINKDEILINLLDEIYAKKNDQEENINLFQLEENWTDFINLNQNRDDDCSTTTFENNNNNINKSIDNQQQQQQNSSTTKTTTNNNLRIQQAAIWELYSTELFFIKGLKVIIELFLSTLLQLQKNSLLLEIDLNRMSSNVCEIYEANLIFLKEHIEPMVARSRTSHNPLDPSLMRNAFVQIRNIFCPYYRYCVEHTSCLSYVKEQIKNNKLFKIYLEWCENQKDCERLRLMDLLAKPMQRLTRYSLLLKSILKRTDNEEDSRALELMIVHMDKFVSTVDLELRRKEDFERLVCVSQEIESYEVKDVAHNSFYTDEIDKLIRRNYCQFDLRRPLFIDCAHQCYRQLLFDSRAVCLFHQSRKCQYSSVSTTTTTTSTPTRGNVITLNQQEKGTSEWQDSNSCRTATTTITTAFLAKTLSQQLSQPLNGNSNSNSNSANTNSNSIASASTIQAPQERYYFQNFGQIKFKDAQTNAKLDIVLLVFTDQLFICKQINSTASSTIKSSSSASSSSPFSWHNNHNTAHQQSARLLACNNSNNICLANNNSYSSRLASQLGSGHLNIPRHEQLKTTFSCSADKQTKTRAAAGQHLNSTGEPLCVAQSDTKNNLAPINNSSVPLSLQDGQSAPLNKIAVGMTTSLDSEPTGQQPQQQQHPANPFAHASEEGQPAEILTTGDQEQERQNHLEEGRLSEATSATSMLAAACSPQSSFAKQEQEAPATTTKNMANNIQATQGASRFSSQGRPAINNGSRCQNNSDQTKNPPSSSSSCHPVGAYCSPSRSPSNSSSPAAGAQQRSGQPATSMVRSEEVEEADGDGAENSTCSGSGGVLSSYFISPNGNNSTPVTQTSFPQTCASQAREGPLSGLFLPLNGNDRQNDNNSNSNTLSLTRTNGSSSDLKIVSHQQQQQQQQQNNNNNKRLFWQGNNLTSKVEQQAASSRLDCINNNNKEEGEGEVSSNPTLASSYNNHFRSLSFSNVMLNNCSSNEFICSSVSGLNNASSKPLASSSHQAAPASLYPQLSCASSCIESGFNSNSAGGTTTTAAAAPNGTATAGSVGSVGASKNSKEFRSLRVIRSPCPIERLVMHELKDGQSVLFCQLNDSLTISYAFVLYTSGSLLQGGLGAETMPTTTTTTTANTNHSSAHSLHQKQSPQNSLSANYNEHHHQHQNKSQPFDLISKDQLHSYGNVPGSGSGRSDSDTKLNHIIKQANNTNDNSITRTKGNHSNVIMMTPAKQLISIIEQAQARYHMAANFHGVHVVKFSQQFKQQQLAMINLDKNNNLIDNSFYLKSNKPEQSQEAEIVADCNKKQKSSLARLSAWSSFRQSKKKPSTSDNQYPSIGFNNNNGKNFNSTNYEYQKKKFNNSIVGRSKTDYKQKSERGKSGSVEGAKQEPDANWLKTGSANTRQGEKATKQPNNNQSRGQKQLNEQMLKAAIEQHQLMLLNHGKHEQLSASNYNYRLINDDYFNILPEAVSLLSMNNQHQHQQHLSISSSSISQSTTNNNSCELSTQRVCGQMQYHTPKSQSLDRRRLLLSSNELFPLQNFNHINYNYNYNNKHQHLFGSRCNVNNCPCSMGLSQQGSQNSVFEDPTCRPSEVDGYHLFCNNNNSSANSNVNINRDQKELLLSPHRYQNSADSYAHLRSSSIDYQKSAPPVGQQAAKGLQARSTITIINSLENCGPTSSVTNGNSKMTNNQVNRHRYFSRSARVSNNQDGSSFENETMNFIVGASGSGLSAAAAAAGQSYPLASLTGETPSLLNNNLRHHSLTSSNSSARSSPPPPPTQPVSKNNNMTKIKKFAMEEAARFNNNNKNNSLKKNSILSNEEQQATIREAQSQKNTNNLLLATSQKLSSYSSTSNINSSSSDDQQQVAASSKEQTINKRCAINSSRSITANRNETAKYHSAQQRISKLSSKDNNKANSCDTSIEKVNNTYPIVDGEGDGDEYEDGVDIDGNNTISTNCLNRSTAGSRRNLSLLKRQNVILSASSEQAQMNTLQSSRSSYSSQINNNYNDNSSSLDYNMLTSTTSQMEHSQASSLPLNQVYHLNQNSNSNNNNRLSKQQQQQAYANRHFLVGHEHRKHGTINHQNSSQATTVDQSSIILDEFNADYYYNTYQTNSINCEREDQLDSPKVAPTRNNQNKATSFELGNLNTTFDCKNSFIGSQTGVIMGFSSTDAVELNEQKLSPNNRENSSGTEHIPAPKSGPSSSEAAIVNCCHDNGDHRPASTEAKSPISVTLTRPPQSENNNNFNLHNKKQQIKLTERKDDDDDDIIQANEQQLEFSSCLFNLGERSVCLKEGGQNNYDDDYNCRKQQQVAYLNIPHKSNNNNNNNNIDKRANCCSCSCCNHHLDFQVSNNTTYGSSPDYYSADLNSRPSSVSPIDSNSTTPRLLNSRQTISFAKNTNDLMVVSINTNKPKRVATATSSEELQFFENNPVHAGDEENDADQAAKRLEQKTNNRASYENKNNNSGKSNSLSGENNNNNNNNNNIDKQQQRQLYHRNLTNSMMLNYNDSNDIVDQSTSSSFERKSLSSLENNNQKQSLHSQYNGCLSLGFNVPIYGEKSFYNNNWITTGRQGNSRSFEHVPLSSLAAKSISNRSSRINIPTNDSTESETERFILYRKNRIKLSLSPTETTRTVSRTIPNNRLLRIALSDASTIDVDYGAGEATLIDVNCIKSLVRQPESSNLSADVTYNNTLDDTLAPSGSGNNNDNNNNNHNSHNIHNKDNGHYLGFHEKLNLHNKRLKEEEFKKRKKNQQNDFNLPIDQSNEMFHHDVSSNGNKMLLSACNSNKLSKRSAFSQLKHKSAINIRRAFLSKSPSNSISSNSNSNQQQHLRTTTTTTTSTIVSSTSSTPTRTNTIDEVGANLTSKQTKTFEKRKQKSVSLTRSMTSEIFDSLFKATSMRNIPGFSNNNNK